MEAVHQHVPVPPPLRHRRGLQVRARAHGHSWGPHCGGGTFRHQGSPGHRRPTACASGAPRIFSVWMIA
jgi:hypothetical protein